VRPQFSQLKVPTVDFGTVEFHLNLRTHARTYTHTHTHTHKRQP